MNIFLQVFDDGRLTDSHGKTVNFRHCVIIMTSNLGASAPKNSGFISGNVGDHYLKEIHKFFPPEMINRMTCIVPFNQLKKDDVKHIIDILLKDLVDGLREKNIQFSITEDAKDWIAENGYDEKFGARPLERLIMSEIDDKITDLLLDNENVSSITVDKDKETNKLIVR
jgi:ATP-dependent Clp protease ATP-binding subunit ClpE